MKVTQAESIAQEIKEIRSAFYCELCEKQYSKISEFETHLSSYAHNHKKRLSELKQQEAAYRQDKSMDGSSSSKKSRQEKERLREEREMKRLQEALLKSKDKNQIQLDIGSTSSSIISSSSTVTSTTTSISTTTQKPIPHNNNNNSLNSISDELSCNVTMPISDPPPKIAFGFTKKTSGTIKFGFNKKT